MAVTSAVPEYSAPRLYLADLDDQHEHFHHVDLRGVVGHDFADEIHPNREGAMRIAERLRAIFKARFPHLI